MTSRLEARRRRALSSGRTIASAFLVAAVLTAAPWPSRGQSSATAPHPPSAASDAAPKAPPPSAAASKPPPSSRKRTQRAACVKEGGSCASAEARCCGNLLCVGGKSSFCAPP
jgi:hypothetical protein